MSGDENYKWRFNIIYYDTIEEPKMIFKLRKLMTYDTRRNFTRENPD